MSAKRAHNHRRRRTARQTAARLTPAPQMTYFGTMRLDTFRNLFKNTEEIAKQYREGHAKHIEFVQGIDWGSQL